MTKISLISNQLPLPGGIRVSMLALCHLLKNAGFEIELCQTIEDMHNPDIVWAHSPSDTEMIAGLKKWKQSNLSKGFIYQIHDFREVCLTGQKSSGSELASCWRPLSAACFGVHFSKGCGGTHNPMALLESYYIKKQQIELMKMADRVVVFSDYLKDQIILNGVSAEKISKTIPYFVPPEDNGRNQNYDNLLWYGRFSPEKGPFEFLHLIRSLKDSGVPLQKAMMIGAGPLEKSLRMLAHEMDLDKILRFENWVAPQYLWNFIKESAFVHFSSLWPEPFGLLGVETMALGVPVIGRPVGGAREWLRDEFGHFAVESEDQSGAFEKAQKILTDKKFQIERSNLLKKSFAKNFSPDIQVKAISKLVLNF